MRYTLSEIARITGGTLSGADVAVDKAVTDSRNAPGGDAPLFIALVGANHDGHGYIGDMYSRGVRGFLVNALPDTDKYPGAGFVVVGNTLDALQKLAAHHRRNFRGRVVAITGSNGKTVTKEWIAQLCPPGVRLFRSPRSYNSQVGVPLSVLMIEGGEDVVVIEAGISMPGEMAKLEAIIKPDIGIITNIGAAHQENFSSLDEKSREKLLLFRDAGTIIYNTGTEIVSRVYPGKDLIAVNGGGDPPVKLPFSDRISVENALQAAALYRALGLTPLSFERLQPVAMRLELREGNAGGMIVNDSYNSDINSLSAALDHLGSVAGERERVLILSDILQSGADAADLYREVARLIEKGGIRKIVGIGRDISACGAEFGCEKEFYPSTEDFTASFDRAAFDGKAVLIKGGRRFRFEKITALLEKKIHSTVLEVDLDAMIHNLNRCRARLASGVKVMAMVKALSYGHGSYEVAAMLQHRRVDYLAVAFADEGVALRETGITMPIVVLNADSWSFEAMIEHRLEPEIYNFTSLSMFIEELNRHGERNYPVHIKLDTGMHRLGFQRGDMEKLIGILAGSDAVKVESIFTHLASSDIPAHDDFTRGQLREFDRLSSAITSALPGGKILRHAANSAAIERFPEAQFDMVRLGIGLYGVEYGGDRELRNVSALKSRIVQIKDMKAGDTVGYCRRGVLAHDARIATVPIGYADGLDRRLGNGAWSFMVNGSPAPTVGNVCMDTCMIDVTGIEAAEGDQVVVFGENPTVQQMAERLGTIPYEIFTSVSTRVKRIYLKE